MLSSYHYEPLADPSRQIRLLQLDTVRDNGAVLTGSLTVYKIPPENASRLARLSNHLQLPGYVAVSYVWGTGAALNPTHEIILDNRRFLITANLHAILHKCRSMWPVSQRCWIDAICINQEDDREKSAQVPLMRDIYHLAMGVSIWIGEENPEIIRLRQFIGNLVNDSWQTSLRNFVDELGDVETRAHDTGTKKRPLTQKVRNESERLLAKGLVKSALSLIKGWQLGLRVAYNPLGALSSENIERNYLLLNDFDEVKSWEPDEKQLKLVEHEDFQEMATLLDKVLFSDSEYFNRMWTLQEICVANGGVVKLLGLQLTDILAVIYYLERNFNIRAHSFEKINTIVEVNSKFNMGQRQSLRALLVLSAGRKSENPRDRIYGLHGLMKDERTPLLKPDYAKSVEEVYANVARHIIYSEKSLDVLCGHQLHNRFPGLPSWVPDFRHYSLEKNSLVQADGENIIYHASLSEEYALPHSQFHVPSEWQRITVTGTLLGSVSVLSDTLGEGQEPQAHNFALAQKLWAAKLTQSEELNPEELRMIAWVSALVSIFAEFYQNSNRATYWNRNLDKLGRLRAIIGNLNNQSGLTLGIESIYFLTLLCGRIGKGTRCNAEELTEHLTRSCVSDQEGTETLEKLCTSLDTGTLNRRLIMSEGKRVGAAAEQTQKGDLIYVLMGCSTPVILRPTSQPNEFQFIGECYWHGFMDGEALKMRDGDKITARELKLV